MKIITTLLLLLLASPVFAETYICSFLNNDGEIDSHRYDRAGDGFKQALVQDREIIFENMDYLVLHYSEVLGVIGVNGGGIYTEITQIEKSVQGHYVIASFQTIFNIESSVIEGTCTVVE
jgi:hypothetical protein